MKDIPSIAIQWAKWLWKDTLSNIITNYYKKIFWKEISRYAFWDILKELTIWSDIEIYNKYKKYYNFNYLEEDIITFKKNENDIKTDLFSKITSEEKTKIENIINSNDISIKDKLFLIDFFKNIPFLKTKWHIQIFSDIIKEDTWNISYFSEYMINKIKKDNNWETKNIINTDTRFLIEAIDLLLNDFILIKLKNNTLNNTFKNKKHLQHVSETELWINDLDIWYTINTENINNNLDKFKRKSPEEIFNDFKKNIHIKLINFKWYSKNFKKELNRIKNNLIKDKKYLYLQNEYSNLYKKYLYNKNNINLEKELLNSYNKYNLYTKKYIKDINKLINIELKNNLNKEIKFKNNLLILFLIIFKFDKK